MEVLIRKTDANGTSIAGDRSFSGNSVSIGKEPGQDIRLAGAGVLAEHAVLKSAGNSLQLVCVKGALVSVAGVEKNKFDLVAGDVVELGSTTGSGGSKIKILEPPGGFDAALEVFSGQADLASISESYKTDLTQTWLGPRKIAWLLVLLTLVTALLLPLTYYFLNSGDGENDSLVSSFPVTDAVWTSGPLHAAHSMLENNCSACHQKLFQKVTNESCENCHLSVNDHIASVESNLHTGIEMNGRCATCHKEHNEPSSTLVVRESQLCTDCHGDTELTASMTRAGTNILGMVTDFADGGSHAEFTVSLLMPPEDGKFDPERDWQQVRVPVEGSSENSQLIFNHKAHYQSDTVVDARGEPIACSYCHVQSSDGEHFEKMEFEKNCSTAGCHDLSVTAQFRLPHGYPDITVSAIEGFYLKELGSDGNGQEADSAREVVKKRRLLGQDEDDRFECDGEAFDCALETAHRKIEQQFTKTGCVTCHLIADNGASENRNRFSVGVVKLTEDFHPGAYFDHISHGVMVDPNNSESISGEAACLYCHDASNSEKSSDILMPAIDNCTDCHNGSTRVNNVPLGCISCHGYHPPGTAEVTETNNEQVSMSTRNP